MLLDLRLLLLDEEFVLGVTKPDGTNTGLTGPTTQTLTGGTLTISGSDQLFENIRYERFPNVTGKRNVWRNCDFAGPPSAPGGGTGLIQFFNANAEDNLLDRCRIRPQFPNQSLMGIFGHGFTAHRCDISGVEDLIFVSHPNSGTGARMDAVIEGCYLHDLFYTCPDTGQSDNRSHSDVVQVTGDVRGVTLRGNNFRGFIDKTISTWAPPTFDGNGVQQSGYQYYPGDWALSCFQHGNTTGIDEDIVIDSNWFDGAAFAFINFAPIHTNGSGIEITNNRWGRSHAAVNDTWTVAASSALPITITGNYYEDNGQAYNGRKNS